MLKSRSKVLFVSAILGILYSLYIISYFLGVNSNATGASEAVGSAIATTLVLPHLILVVLATIFNILAFFMNSKGFAITCGVLYAIAGAAFLLYIMFVIPMIILSFIGVTKVSKIKQMQADGGESFSS